MTADREWVCFDCGFTKPVTNGAPIGTEKRCLVCRGVSRSCATIESVGRAFREMRATKDGGVR